MKVYVQLIILLSLGKALSHISEALAANKIQSLWKGAIARKKVRKAREEELIFIGMVSGWLCK